MNVSSVKNLNGETFSAVQDATLTNVVQTNSGNWNTPVSNSGDLYKVEFDGVDLYGYKSTSSITDSVYNVVSSQQNTSIQYTIYPQWNNQGIQDLRNWSGFDIISISSNGSQIRPSGYPDGVTALDVYFNAQYVYDYNDNQLDNFSGYIGKITLDNLVASSYFDKPSYYNNIARCHDFRLWFSANNQPDGQIDSNYICSVGKEQSITNTISGIIVPDAVDLSNYYTKSETSGASEIADALANIPTGNPEVENYVQTNSGTIDDVNTSYQTNSGTFLTAHQDLSDYYTTADANTLSSMLSGAIDYVSANAGDQEVHNIVHTNSATWDSVTSKLDTTAFSDVSGTFLTAHQAISAEEWNSNYETVNTNSGVWGGSALPISAGPGIDVKLSNDVLVFSAVPNETVIYTSTVPSNTLVFSEPCTNFERIRLELSSYQETTTCNYYEIKPNANKLTYFSNTFVSNATYPLQILGCQFTGTDGVTYTNTTGVRVCFSTDSNHTVRSYGTNGSSIATDSNRDAGFITKVIGINRIGG